MKEVCQGTLGIVRVLTVYCSKQVEGSNSQEDVLLLFTMNNYHWYLKQTLRFPEGVRAFLWDSQERLRVMAARFHSYRFVYNEIEFTIYNTQLVVCLSVPKRLYRCNSSNSL